MNYAVAVQADFYRRAEQCIHSALLEEVYTTPKPGLVDWHDSGAHQDMDCGTFERSAEAIAPYLTQMLRTGVKWCGSAEQLFQESRRIGKLAENAMFEATGGVNTHKGLVFTMGILCAAAGLVYQERACFDRNFVFDKVIQMARRPLEKEFIEMKQRPPRTHGEKLYLRRGEKGIRGEAQEGFPILRDIACPMLYNSRLLGLGRNEGNINVLLCIMAKLNDTNILHRGDDRALLWIKENALQAYRKGGAFSIEGRKAIKEMNQECIRRNLSPGGSADLLAAAIFLWELEQIKWF